MLTLSASDTALILVDLQEGVVNLPMLAPRSGRDVVAVCEKLGEKFREAAAPVVLVNVAWSRDGDDLLTQPVDLPMLPPPGGFPENWSTIVPSVAQPSDIRVTKHQWGAFFGTDLDVQLRRRGIKTVVIAGIATNMGVESTARQAHEHGYNVVIIEDACTSVDAQMHGFAFAAIFPMIARVTTETEIIVRNT